MRSRMTVVALLGLSGLIALNMGGCGGVVDKAAQTTLYGQLGDMSITVFPVFVRDGEMPRYNPDARETIGTCLTDNDLGTVSLASAEVPITSVWGMNQAKMFKQSVADFAAHVRSNAVATDYALLAEYLIGGQGAPVGVHIYLVDAEGAVAYARLLNSHHDEFNAVNPQSVADCTTMVMNVLRSDLSEANKTASARLGKLPADVSVTIMPVQGVGSLAKDVADVIGLMLEQEGMSNVQPITSKFLPPEDATLEQIATALAKHMKAEPVTTDYVLFGEFRGSPGSGVDEVRGVLLDKSGNVVWRDSQQPGDAEFDRIKPSNPMSCCVLFKEIIRPQFAAAPPIEDGPMARLCAEKSGTPTKAEYAAMLPRQEQMKKNIQGQRLAVYPVLVGTEVNTPDATHLAELLANQFECKTEVAPEMPIKVAPNSNEQRRLWDLARAFQAKVLENPPDAEYALYAEYTIRPRDQMVWTVHFVVCDRAGEWVIVDFQNNHHADFQQVNPQTHADCATLIAQRLQHYLK
ncbi:MAG: hypothetical protein ABIG44_18685 [Planctomycetota bacterium]